MDTVAYFSAEFALDGPVPEYAGGLGVFAGDFVRAAAAANFPLVGIGLYYHPSAHTPSSLTPVTAASGNRLTVTIPLPDHPLYITAWKWSTGSVPVYLLDTDIPQNSSADHHITEVLYTADKETRFKQEMVLGIGGLRFLAALNIHPSIYHANEGHSALLAFELIHHEMSHRHVDFNTALSLTRQRLVFTNHTLVAAGQETFSNDLVATLLSTYAEEIQIPVDQLVNLGLVQQTSIFSLTMLSLRLAGRANAVSRLHAEKASSIWTDHPMVGITNGIYIPNWDSLTTSNPIEIWPKHLQNKNLLLEYIANTTGTRWGQEVLLAGWARRLVSYKRPLVALQDPDRFFTLANSSPPLRLVISGSAPTADREAQKILGQINQLAADRLHPYIVYLPEYTTELAKMLVSGCDVWLNTPVVGFEACGTSGMKAALNGCLPISTRDGWVHEVELFKIGWTLNSDNLPNDLNDQLQHLILPMYADHLRHPDKSDWLDHMHNARQLIQNKFSMARVLQNYIDLLYLPSLNQR